MSSKNIEIEILHKDKNCNARYGLLKTPHGTVELPMFMPVGTLATVKSLSPKVLNGDRIHLPDKPHVLSVFEAEVT